VPNRDKIGYDEIKVDLVIPNKFYRMLNMNTARDIFALIIALVCCYAAAGIGSLFTTPAIPGWYAGLQKPSWNPPNWVFGPVWTLLFTLMAIAAWLVWRRIGTTSISIPLVLFAIQLVLNVLWSYIFFGRHLPGSALIEIILLWLAILTTLISFWRVAPLAGGLLLPYLLWVSYAISLNAGVWRLNR
jgi:translocator protein